MSLSYDELEISSNQSINFVKIWPALLNKCMLDSSHRLCITTFILMSLFTKNTICAALTIFKMYLQSVTLLARVAIFAIDVNKIPRLYGMLLKKVNSRDIQIRIVII